MAQIREYTHLGLAEDCHCLVGHYTPLKEVRLPYNGREVLYMVGQAVIEASCCSAPGAWSYVLVPGYIINWQGKNKDGLPVSDVEPISDKEEKAKIRLIIRQAENINQVDFW